MRVIQLLHHRLFPATVINPATLSTFQVLKHFQMLNFTSKISGSAYYDALMRLTNNTGLDPPPVSGTCIPNAHGIYLATLGPST